MAGDRSVFYTIRRKGQVLMYKLTSKEFVSKLYFLAILHYPLNLKKPKTFNEKLQWLKLYYWPNCENAIRCADKYEVRSYIKELGKEDILNDILFAWDSVDEIDWAELPNQFVLKCNHGCGYNIICTNKNNLDYKATLKLLDKWMHEDFSEYNAEPHYSKIKRKIICEKFLEGEVVNYNIYILNGKATFLSVAGGLGNGSDEYLTYYNPDGSVADFKNRSFPQKEEKLSVLLPEMVTMAEYLAGDFPMVRVDLFDIDGKIILSEMTFTPGGALIPFDSKKADKRLGDRLDISKQFSY